MIWQQRRGADETGRAPLHRPDRLTAVGEPRHGAAPGSPGIVLQFGADGAVRGPDDARRRHDGLHHRDEGHLSREPSSPARNDPGQGPDDLAAVARSALRSAVQAERSGNLTVASAALRRCHQVAALLAVQAPHRDDAAWLQADALYRLAGLQLAHGRFDEARAGLDTAEGLYSRLGSQAAGPVADVRARRARAHAELGRGLSALVDAQAAVLHHVQTLDPDEPQDRAAASDPDEGQFALAGALTGAAVVQAAHGSSRLALSAAQQAGALLRQLADVPPSPGDHDRGGRENLALALGVEIRMLRALDRTLELDAPVAVLHRTVGADPVRRLLDGPPDPPRPGLARAVEHELVAPETRDALTRMLVRPLDGVSIPGFLVEPAWLLDAARQGAATALALAGRHPALALAAGRDAACLYACAEELGLVEHPWPLVRIELARWLWLLTELGWLAWTLGDAVLARDLAQHAQHPLIRAESGAHLPSSIARSLNDSASRLSQLRLELR